MAAVLLLAVACKTPATKAAKARDELASWAATGRMLSNGWARGDAQTPYVKSTTKVASGEVDKLQQDLQDDKDSMQSLREVSSLYDRLSKAVQAEDRGAAAQIGGGFANVSTRLQQQKPS